METGLADRRSDTRSFPRRGQARGPVVVVTRLLIVGTLLPGLGPPALAREIGESLSGIGDGGAFFQATEQFSDLSEAGPHRASVEALAARGILEGTECAAGRFCPSAHPALGDGGLAGPDAGRNRPGSHGSAAVRGR